MKGRLITVLVMPDTRHQHRTPTRAEINRVRNFSDDVREKIFSAHPKNSTTVQPNNSITEQLEKLANLKDRGILTKEEFDMQKKKLLDL